jgi:desampylase
MWVMHLELSSQQRHQLLDWAEAAGIYECCGLLLGEKGVVERVELTTNVADDPRSHFEIDPSALILAEKYARQGGPQILGYFHSHPNGLAMPSATDAALAAPDGRHWLIIADGTMSLWQPVGDPVTFTEEELVEG